MVTGNPMRLVKKLDWGSRNPRQEIGDIQTLRISPNGQYIAISGRGAVYIFDLHQPDMGWQQVAWSDDAEMVAPTDSGGYWVLHKDKIALVNNDGKTRMGFHWGMQGSIWGNDGWILVHDEKYLKFASLSDSRIYKVVHKYLVLHAWMHGNQLRLLSFYDKEMDRLCLHEWSCDNHVPVFKSSIGYPHRFGVKGVGDYLFSKHVHAWPDDNVAVTVKLKPWAVTISGDGAMHISEDHMAWSPIIRSNAPLDRQILAKVSAYALDGGLNDRGFAGLQLFSRTTPFLITTLQHADVIHVITTHWHKCMSVELTDMLLDAHLDVCLDNEDVATLFLANCGEHLPHTERTAITIIGMLKRDYYFEYYKQILDRFDSSDIYGLLKSFFIATIRKDMEPEWNPHVEIRKMHEVINILSKKREVAGAFFDAFDDPGLKDGESKRFADTIKPLIPLLPAQIRTLLPTDLLLNIPTLSGAIAEADPETAVFLIKNALPGWLNIENVIFMLERFYDDEAILEIILDQVEEVILKLPETPNDKREQFSRRVAQLIDSKPYIAYQLVQLMMRHGITFPEDINDPYIDVGHLLYTQGSQTRVVAATLAKQSGSNNQLINKLIEEDVSNIRRIKLIPDFIQTMAKLNCTENKDSLVRLNEISSKGLHALENDEHRLIVSIWRLADDLDDECRKAFATVLFAAINRCLGQHAISERTSDRRGSGKPSLMSKEATLLQEKRAQESRFQKQLAIQEILDCIGADGFQAVKVGNT